MEETKQEIKNKNFGETKLFKCCDSFLRVRWIKIFIGFIVLMLIFCLGFRCGELRNRQRNLMGASRHCFQNVRFSGPRRGDFMGDRIKEKLNMRMRTRDMRSDSANNEMRTEQFGMPDKATNAIPPEQRAQMAPNFPPTPTAPINQNQ